jgi:protocatechuate 3,4-dioxygenase beta subunit
MKLSWRKASSLLAALALSVTGVTALATSAQAADSTNIRLVTPVITADNSVDHQGDMTGWINNTWYAAGSTFHKMYAPVGGTINLTYQATDSAGNPLRGKTITLHVNKGWSGSKAVIKSGSTVINGSDGGNDGGTLTAVTDGFGDATFTLQNTDSTSTEDNPAKLTDEPKGSSLLFSQIYPEYAGQATDSADMIEFHFVNTMPNAVSAGAEAYLAAVGPSLNDNNSVDQQDSADYYVSQSWYASGLQFRQAYTQVGSAVNAAWQYTDADGNPIVGETVQLVVNKAWSSSSATLTSGSTNIAPTNGGNDSAVLSATTDAFGVAVFPLLNTDSTSTETDPSTLTSEPAGSGQLYSQTFAQVASKVSHSALIEYHFVNNVPVLGGGTPTPTPTPTGSGPAVANIRLLDSEKDTTKDAFLTPGWYNPDGDNSPAFIKYGTVGETTTLTYVATDGDGNPIADTAIYLMVNSPNEHATYTKSDDSALDAAPTQAAWWGGYQNNTFGGAVSGTTDADGKVTFVVKNTNKDANGESIRDVKNVWSDSSNGNTLAAGFYPTMLAATEHIDRIWYHLQQATAQADTSVTIRLLDSEKDLSLDTADVTNWWSPDGIYSPAYLKYFTVGSTITLTYQVLDHDGNAIKNAPIWLNINEGGNNATFTKADGSALDAAKTGWKFVGYDSASFAGSVSGTTDANGRVTFTLKNADTNDSAENIRTVKNTWSDPTGDQLKGAFYPTLAGSNLEHIDRVWGHIVKMGPATLTAAHSTVSTAVGTSSSLVFTLHDAAGNAISGATVHFTTNAGGTLGSATGTTDNSGNVTVVASATAAGSQLVSASYIDSDNQAAVANSTVTWTASAAKATVSVKKRVITVTVTNSKGKTQVVTVTGLKKSTKKLTSASASTKFTVKKAGKYTVKVTVAGKVLLNKKVSVK